MEEWILTSPTPILGPSRQCYVYMHRLDVHVPHVPHMLLHSFPTQADKRSGTPCAAFRLLGMFRCVKVQNQKPFGRPFL